MGYIKGEERSQTYLFPESFDDYIHEDNPVRIIDEYVEQLDMKEQYAPAMVVPHIILKICLSSICTDISTGFAHLGDSSMKQFAI